MYIEELREYLLNKPGAIECMPFDETTLVYKVGNKIFALYGIDNIPLRCNLKCLPERSIELREQYESILPGWHMDKKHWNTVVFTEEIDY
ncbi:MAG: MmcQ-like protein [Bacteroidetes bacterium 4572_77]|nr:MAG: MmcQ-like protein [Bacteroidetes bacterium 4572_77]